jgi:tRNA nucleotidyltransferase (CCA-adding enzyme)
MERVIEELVGKLNENIKKRKIKAEVFVGGSSGKGTVIKREKFDIDIFVRFLGYKNEEISEKLEKILLNLEKKKIHGSRDYFKVSYRGFGFEVVPVLLIKKMGEAKNVTDLSYFHVSYVKRKIKEGGIRDDIMLAKSFCYAQNCYGAESYIKGFSGYALELLVIYYKSFEKMIKAISKLKVDKEKKIVIDIEKDYKNKKVEEEMNEAKLSSPIILIDPTYKERNALSSLSYETFYKFQQACKKFIKKPSEKLFEKQRINKKNFNLILEARTNKQEGDVAGSKLKKFYDLVGEELKKGFIVGNKEFEYDDKKKADYYFKIKVKKEIILTGPPINAVENVSAFKAKHKNVFIKNNKVYAREKGKNIGEFLKEFKKINKKRMKDMGIVSLN